MPGIQYFLRLWGLVCALVVWGGWEACASPMSHDKPCTLTATVRSESVHPQGPGMYLELTLQPQKGWKIYAPPQGSTGYPPKLVLETSEDVLSFQEFWPQGVPLKHDTFQAWVYDTLIHIPVRLIMNTHTPHHSPTVVRGVLNVLACSDTLCVPCQLPFEALLEPPLKRSIHSEESSKTPLSLFVLWGFAFLGGALLHLMPCVLPVLGLKLAQWVQMPPATIRLYHTGSICGIQGLFCVAGLIWALMKWSGTQWGWGLHFQNPLFIVLLSCVLLVLCAQLRGWRTLSLPAWISQSTWGDKRHSPWAQGLVDGIFMTLLATPCTAPFLGTALGISLAQHKPWQIFVTFSCIGLGFCLPYIVLFAVPLSRLPLPKPGPWMVRLKNIASWGILSVLIGLGYVFASMVAPVTFYLFCVLLTGLGALLKIQKTLYPKIYQGIIVLWCLGLGGLVLDLQKPFKPHTTLLSSLPTQGWVAFDTARLDRERAQRPVLVNITAQWCMTCHLNQRVWRNTEVQKKLRQCNVLLMEGDITRPHPELERLIQSHQRAGVPFSVLYTPAHPRGIVFSELLTVQSVLDTLNVAQ